MKDDSLLSSASQFYEKQQSNERRKKLARLGRGHLSHKNSIHLPFEHENMSENQKNQFKYLFQIPMIITDPKIVQRRQTYEIFSKDAHLEQFYLQLKKAKGIAKTIGRKTDYKEVVSQINNNKIQDGFVHKFRREQGLIYTNQLWSQQQINQVYDQSRLKELSELLQMKKIKISKEDQIKQFEKVFVNKHKQDDYNPAHLIKNLKQAFSDDIPNCLDDSPQPLPTQKLESSKSHYQFEVSTKQSRAQSRNFSQNRETRPQTRDFSVFSKRGSTSHILKRKSILVDDNFYSIFTNTPQYKLQNIIFDTQKASSETKNIIKQVGSFEKNEKTLEENKIQQRFNHVKVKRIQVAVQQNKDRQLNSHVIARLYEQK
ncbi:hypothetical protein pb186bvf_013570 [Paramecium bursaria]